MKVEFTRNFEKQIDHLHDSKLKDELGHVVRIVLKAEQFNQIPNVKKLKGFKSAYRIRSGNYRIGIIYREDKVIFAAFAHRKDIYRIFP